MDFAKNMIKMPSAEEAENPKVKLNGKNTTPRYPSRSLAWWTLMRLKLSGMGSIPGTAAGLRGGGRLLQEAQKMSFSQEAAEGNGNGVGNEGNQTLPELYL